jgi:hypothetical protein
LISDLRNFSGFDSHTRTRLYEDVRELCHLINGTDEKKNLGYKVPQYNGGLFDPTRHPDLEQWRVSDAVLADVLRGLMFNPVPERGQAAFPGETVDFGDLRVQQLGSIYEGLMEHHFHREKDSLRLVADKAERRQTGTYYTPDYIVKYIVQNTVGPLLAEIDRRENVRAARSAGLKDNSFANAALEVNILDPAMGSGHFLVEATTHLAEEIASHPTTKPLSEKSKDEDEIAHWRGRVVESCIYGVDLNPLAVELAKLSLWLTTVAADRPLDFLDHHLCCGNSLLGAQLTDLGHVPDLKRKKAAGLKFTWKLTDNLLAALQKAVCDTKQIEERISETVADVKSKERIWIDSVRPALRPFRSVANLWLACFFGNDLPQHDYEALVELLDVDPDKIRPWKNATEFQDIVIGAVEKGEIKLAGRDFDKNQLKNLCAFLIRAERIAIQHHFFHWELEFPEIFFEDTGKARASAGFDAVLGNPPYFLLQGTDYQKPLRGMFPEIFSGSNDVSHFFLMRGSQLLANERMLGCIVTRYWIEAHLTAGLRNFLTTYVQPAIIVDLVNLQVCPDVNVLTLICLFTKGRVDKTAVYIADEVRYATAQDFLLNGGEQPCWVDPRALGRDPWRLRAIETTSLWETVRSRSIPLDEITENTQGIKTGNNEIFTVSPVTVTKLNLEQQVLIPVARAQDVRRYAAEANRFVIYMDGTFEIDEVPSIKSYLLQFKTRLSERAECNEGIYPWWRLQRPREKTIILADERILVPLYATHNRFCLCKEKMVGMTDVYIIAARDKDYSLAFICAVLNSNLLNLYHATFCKVKRAGYLEYSGNAISRLPIRRIEFKTPLAERARLIQQSRQLYSDCLADADSREMLRFVEQQLSAKPERCDTVHDFLAFLADRMIALNEERRTTAKQFLNDLKDFYNVDSRTLNPKTKLDQFWKLEPADVFAHFRANKVPLTGSDEEKIRERFSKARFTLDGLDSQIAFTDRLIDQIVYRLYGLTPEEIKIVEGDSNAKIGTTKAAAT